MSPWIAVLAANWNAGPRPIAKYKLPWIEGVQNHGCKLPNDRALSGVHRLSVLEQGNGESKMGRMGGGARVALVQIVTHQLKATGSGVKSPWIDDSSRLQGSRPGDKDFITPLTKRSCHFEGARGDRERQTTSMLCLDLPRCR